MNYYELKGSAAYVSAISPYYMDRAIAVFCENLTRFAHGKELLFEVNWDIGF